MSQQHIEAASKDQLLRSLEPNTLASSSSRLPLRKRVAPVLKWQPVETPQEHVKQKPIYNSYPLQQYPPSPPSLPSSTALVEDLAPSSDAMETDEEKQLQEGEMVSNSKLLKKHWITKEDSKRSFSEDSTSSSSNKDLSRVSNQKSRLLFLFTHFIIHFSLPKK